MRMRSHDIALDVAGPLSTLPARKMDRPRWRNAVGRGPRRGDTSTDGGLPGGYLAGPLQSTRVCERVRLSVGTQVGWLLPFVSCRVKFNVSCLLSRPWPLLLSGLGFQEWRDGGGRDYSEGRKGRGGHPARDPCLPGAVSRPRGVGEGAVR